MTKQYCDVCGKPAMERRVYVETTADRWESYGAARVQGVSVVQGNWQPGIVVHAKFAVTQHKTIPEGASPDLCPACMVDLLKELIVKIEPGREAVPAADNLAKVEEALVAERQFARQREDPYAPAGPLPGGAQ